MCNSTPSSRPSLKTCTCAVLYLLSIYTRVLRFHEKEINCCHRVSTDQLRLLSGLQESGVQEEEQQGELGNTEIVRRSEERTETRSTVSTTEWAKDKHATKSIWYSNYHAALFLTDRLPELSPCHQTPPAPFQLQLYLLIQIWFSLALLLQLLSL